jgi:hypothetical protein
MRKIYIVTILLIVVPLLTSGFVPGKINGSVFIDTNKNGVRDKGEEGIVGVLVSNQITVVATDATGR